MYSKFLLGFLLMLFMPFAGTHLHAKDRKSHRHTHVHIHGGNVAYHHGYYGGVGSGGWRGWGWDGGYGGHYYPYPYYNPYPNCYPHCPNCGCGAPYPYDPYAPAYYYPAGGAFYFQFR